MATIHLALILTLAAPSSDMPDAHGPEWTAPAPPPGPAAPLPTMLSSTTSTSPYVTSTRPFDPSTPAVGIYHEPSTRSLSARERKLVWASGGVSLAAIPAIVFMSLGIVKMGRIKSQVEAQFMEDPFGPYPYDLVQKYDRQRGIVIGTSVAAFLLSTTGLVLLFVATRRHRQRGTRRVITQASSPLVAMGSR